MIYTHKHIHTYIYIVEELRNASENSVLLVKKISPARTKALWKVEKKVFNEFPKTSILISFLLTVAQWIGCLHKLQLNDYNIHKINDYLIWLTRC